MKHFTAADGLKLAYDDVGKGPVLLCLPGLTRNMDDFEPVVDHFAHRASVIRMDFRGRGASGYDPDYSHYNVVQESQDVIGLLDHLGLEKAAILGTSRGGLVAMTLAATARDRLAGVCFNDIGPVIEPAGLTYIMGYLGLPPADPDFDTALREIPKRMGKRFPNVPVETWANYIRRVWAVGEDGSLSLRYDPKLRDATLDQMKAAEGQPAPDLWPLFAALDGLPLALIRGANSDLLSPDTAAKMREMHPGMLFSDVADRGHVPFLDEPESLSVISQFLDRLT
ncbi:alpha/beta hydrolase [Nioella sp. MMSF_3534]|uniref:alpha/beta fold hydrolase n=1 Tax=Nioella sp. MMSF_3534 TaxID=3046720 RepID=UPI00273DD10E|nr:alpha/beta hydrolase [Nioella sp. MMSF_3534]